MPETEVIHHPGFAGGANLRDAPNKLDPDQARRILNLILDERGGATKRQGSTLQANAPARIISLYPFYTGGSFQLVGHFSDGSVRYTIDLANWVTIWTGLSTTARFSFETYNSNLYLSNGVNDYRKWTGSVASTFPTAPKGKYLRVWKDAMFVAGVTGQESRVYESDIGNPDSFPALGFGDVHRGDGDAISGLAATNDGLLVTKKRRAFLLFDPVTFANRIVDPDKGCESHFSIISHLGLIYLLSGKGVCIYHGAGPMEIISENIEPIFQHNILSISELEKSWAYTHENRVGWSVPLVGSTDNNFQMEYYPTIERKPWAFHRFPGACFATLRSGTTERLYYGSATANKLQRAFEGDTDDGVEIPSLLETGWTDLGDLTVTKYIRSSKVLGRGNFFFSIKKDYESSESKLFLINLAGGEVVDLWGGPGDLWGESGDTWGNVEVLGEQRVEPDFYGKSFAFRFSDQEGDAGTRHIDVGGQDISLVSGAWAVYDLYSYLYGLGDRR